MPLVESEPVDPDPLHDVFVELAREFAPNDPALMELVAQTAVASKAQPTRSVVEKLNYSVKEAADALGIGETKMYELVYAKEEGGGVLSIKIGDRVLIPVRALEDYVYAKIAKERGLDKGTGQAARSRRT